MEAYSLGLGDPVPISAEHGEGMADLYQAVLDAVGRGEPEEAEEEAEPEIFVETDEPEG